MSDHNPWEPDFETVEPSAIRRAIGERTQTSFRDIPQFDVSRQVLAGPMMTARTRLKAAGAAPLPTFNDYLIKLTGDALPVYPTLNSWWEDDVVKLLKSVNVGFVCETEEGILLPTVFDVDHKTLGEIAGETRQLIAQARAGRLRASFQRGAGITLTNIGPAGVDQFNGIISPPQTAILAIASVAPRPVVEGDSVVIQPTMYLTISLDHRVHDGRRGAEFLAELAKKLADEEHLRNL